MPFCGVRCELNFTEMWQEFHERHTDIYSPKTSDNNNYDLVYLHFRIQKSVNVCLGEKIDSISVDKIYCHDLYFKLQNRMSLFYHKLMLNRPLNNCY